MNDEINEESIDIMDELDSNTEELAVDTNETPESVASISEAPQVDAPSELETESLDHSDSDDSDLQTEDSSPLYDQKAQDAADVKMDESSGFSLRLNETEGDFEQMLEDYDEPEPDEQDFKEEPEEELKGKLPYGGFEPARLKSILEGMVFAAGKTITLGELQRLFEDQERPSKKDIKCLLAEIIAGYEHQGIELIETAAGYRFQTRQQDALWIARLFGEKPQKYSRAMLETTALIAYRQPITRGEIEDVRGVAVSSYIIKTLLERQWIRVVGHREVPGRPAMFATTKQFLDYFGLNSLTQMPTLAEIKNIEDINPQLALPDTGAVDKDKEASMDELVEELKDETKEREADTYLDEELANDLKELDVVNKGIEVSFEAQRAVGVSQDDPDYEKSQEKANSFEQMVKSFNDENPVEYDEPLPQLAEGFEDIAQSFEQQTVDKQSDETSAFEPSHAFAMNDEDNTSNGLSVAGLMGDQSAQDNTSSNTQSQPLSDNQQLQQTQDEISQEEQMRIIEEKLAQQAALMAAQSLQESQEEDENE